MAAIKCHKRSHFSFISLQTAFTGSKCSHPTSTSHSEQRHKPRVTERKSEEEGHEVKPLLICISQCAAVSHACLLLSIHMERRLPLKNECENLKVMKKSKNPVASQHIYKSLLTPEVSPLFVEQLRPPAVQRNTRPGSATLLHLTDLISSFLLLRGCCWYRYMSAQSAGAR